MLMFIHLYMYVCYARNDEEQANGGIVEEINYETKKILCMILNVYKLMK